MIPALCYEGRAVVDVSDVFESGGVWYGRIASAVPAGRVQEYANFCIEWQTRLDRGDCPDAAEFDEYRDVVRTGAWTATCEGCGAAMATMFDRVGGTKRSVAA